ncbi:MAG TPA: MFS transporter [Solirubrobacteraceae bacterium]|nr:MFS transporter [Solirubrobacteraceae bacterium]
MRQYLEILRTPHMTRLFAAALLARLPMGINGLAIVLLMKAETGSFGAAGATAGALALGSGLCAPLTARLIDVLGARTLLALSALSAGGLIAVVALARAGAPAAAVVAAAFVAGGSFPPTSSVMRAQYPRLFADRPALLQGAFALDSVITESIFTVAPLLTAALVVVFEPAAALLVSAAAVVAGTVVLVAALPPDEGRALDDPDAVRSRLGALANPGIRTLVGSMLPVGFAFGALEVALPAFADHEGRPELAGVLVALWAFGSVAGGLTYGARPRRGTLASVHLRVALLLPVSFLPMALATSPATMALLVLPAGVLIAPLIATRNELAGMVAPEGARTEAYTWPLTALVAGIALGAATAGALADATSWQTAVLAAAVAAAVGAAVSTGRRATLVPA